MTPLEQIAKERDEQISLHGHSVQSDVLINNQGQLIEMAHDLLLDDEEVNQMLNAYDFEFLIPEGWDGNTYKKLLMKPYRERRIIAASLILADLEREDYEQNNLMKNEQSN